MVRVGVEESLFDTNEWFAVVLKIRTRNRSFDVHLIVFYPAQALTSFRNCNTERTILIPSTVANATYLSNTANISWRTSAKSIRTAGMEAVLGNGVRK